MQLLQRQAGHLNHSKAASWCVIRKNKAVQNKPLNILRSPPLPQRLHVSTTVLVIGALHLSSLHLTSLLARQRGGSAPSILLRCSPCLPRTALPLSSRHRSTVPSIRAALQTTGRPPHAVNSSHLVPAWRRHRHRLLARAVGGRSPCDGTQKADRSRLRRQRESVRPVARVCESDGQIPVAAFHAVDPDGRIWSPLQPVRLSHRVPRAFHETRVSFRWRLHFPTKRGDPASL